MATAGRALLMSKGAWVSGNEYVPMDYVYYGGNSYVCKSATSGTTTPDNDTTHWQLMASGFDMDMITQTITNEQNKIASDAAVYAETVKLEAQDAALAANMATVETTSTASKPYAVGEQLVYQNLLYKAKVAIAAGETFVVGTNIERTTEGAEITAIKESLSSFKCLVTEQVTISTTAITRTLPASTVCMVLLVSGDNSVLSGLWFFRIGTASLQMFEIKKGSETAISTSGLTFSLTKTSGSRTSTIVIYRLSDVI